MNKCSKFAATLFAGMIAGCSSSGSGGGSNTNNTSGGGNGDASTLQVIASKIIYSKIASASDGYVTLINPTAAAVKNLHYSLSQQIGGGNFTTIDEASASNCAIILANSSCNIKLNVAAGAIAGSLGFSVNNDASLASELIKSSQSTTTALPIGVEQAYYNSVIGADGVTLSYYHTVIAGVPYILVSGIVASDKAGSFNKIVLVDGNGHPLPNQQLISGNVSSTQGSTFSVLLPISVSSGISQTIKVQTQQVASDGGITIISTATGGSTLTTTSGVGITDMLPGAIYLTTANPEQTITLVNSGDTLAQLQSLIANNPNIEVVFSPVSLNRGETTTATFKLKNPVLPATSGAITLNYNNGKENTSTSAVAEQNVSPQPNPSPSPTPTPVPPAPIDGLTSVISPDNDFFTTTAIGTVSRQLTLTNSGNTVEDNLVLTLPANFTISSGNSNSCTVTQGTSPATISDSLAASSGSCDVTVTYNNTTATAQNTGDISIAYNYNGSSAATPVTAAVNYRVTQSTANLTLTNPWSPYNFINIASDNTDLATQIFTVYNSGEAAATNVVGSINPASIFSILSNYSSTIAAGTSGNLNLQFGPSSTLGAQATTLAVSYDDYPSHAATPITVAISGSVSNAIAYLQNVGASGFAGGNGTTAATAYALQTATNGQITLTYKNKGNENATNFKLTTGTISDKLTGIPFTLVTDGCNLDGGGKTLAPSETCAEVLQYSPTSAGATTLPLNTASWQFSYSDTHGNYTYNSAPVYFNAYAPASISITTSGLTTGESVALAGSFDVIANLSNGYNEAPQTIILQNLNPSDNDINISNTCDVSSASSSCTISVLVGANAVKQAYTLSVVNQTGAVQIISGSSVSFNVYDPVPVGSETTLGAAAEVGCFIKKSTKQPYCWGNNHMGELGIGSFLSKNIPTAVLMGGSSAIPLGTLITQVSVAVAGERTDANFGSSSVCALSSSKNLYCWGNNAFGQLGNGTNVNSNVPVSVIQGVIPSNVKLIKVTDGADHVCAVGSDGNIYCWGRNDNGQLGNGNTTSSNSPVKVIAGNVPSGVKLVDVGAGVRGTCAIGDNGKVYCWGDYYSGNSSSSPKLLSGGALPANYSAVAVSLAHDDVQKAACLITSAGSAYCWGSNDGGQLGNGTNTGSNTPVLVSRGQIPLVAKFVSISQGGYSTCAVTDQGKAYCWGNNSYGQLGVGTQVAYNTPQEVVSGGSSQLPNNTFLQAISGGYDDDSDVGEGRQAMFCAQSSTDNVYCWGGNYFGQLGYGVTGGSGSFSAYAKAVTMP